MTLKIGAGVIVRHMKSLKTNTTSATLESSSYSLILKRLAAILRNMPGQMVVMMIIPVIGSGSVERQPAEQLGHEPIRGAHAPPSVGSGTRAWRVRRHERPRIVGAGVRLLVEAGEGGRRRSPAPHAAVVLVHVRGVGVGVGRVGGEEGGAVVRRRAEHDGEVGGCGGVARGHGGG